MFEIYKVTTTITFVSGAGSLQADFTSSIVNGCSSAISHRETYGVSINKSVIDNYLFIR